MMRRSTANPAMERSMGPKATVTGRVLARSTWTGVKGWASSQRGELGPRLLPERSHDNIAW